MSQRRSIDLARGARGRVIRDRLMTAVFTGGGWIAIVFIALIFLFTFREALPIFTDPEVSSEANLKKFFVERQEGELLEQQFVWQPVGEVPKFSFIPLILGTLKATFVGAKTVKGPPSCSI